ncbi:diguanylate cyclase, partial [bacterium]|nr:diguanylate cyclase [bacterium]
DSDIVFRYGGEEFVLLLIETTKKGAYIVSERARKRVQELKFKREVTISMGVSAFPIDARNSDELFELADKALYTAKAQGKNQVCLYHTDRRGLIRIPSQVTASISLMGTEKIFETAIKDVSQGGIAFYSNYPVKVDDVIKGEFVLSDEGMVLFTGKVVWSEALDKDKYIVGLKFFEIAQESGKVIESYIEERV